MQRGRMFKETAQPTIVDILCNSNKEFDFQVLTSRFVGVIDQMYEIKSTQKKNGVQRLYDQIELLLKIACMFNSVECL